MTVYGMTDVGKRRDENQDTLEFFELSDGGSVIIVCDGMGGAAGGATASGIAKSAIANSIKSAYNADLTPRGIKNLLYSAISAANIGVFDRSLCEQSLQGMGTTVVVALIRDGNAYIAHVGDSRAYLYHSGTLEQLTTDHSIVQMLLQTGQITNDEAQNHPKRNIITRALGIAETVELDYLERQLEQNSILLLCTDGLTNYASPERICEILENYKPSDCPGQLIDAANHGGGGDNITVALAAQTE